jgi:penicillin amidase
VQIKFTRHGPVLWDDGRRALALRWVGDEPGSAGYLASLTLDRARNWREFEAAMPRWKVPSENIVYADRAGNIGEHSTGLAPWRKNWTGLLPVPGNGHGLDGLPAAAALFDRGPLRRSGDGEVVQATSFSDGSFEQDDGASYREIFDLADWDASVGINVPGQSGQPAAKHYDDLLPMWLEGRYFPLAYSKKAVNRVTSDSLELIPQ